MIHQPITAQAPRRLDRTRAECAALVAAGPAQPNNALYSRTPEELTDALFAICRPYRSPEQIRAEIEARMDADRAEIHGALMGALAKASAPYDALLDRAIVNAAAERPL